MHNGNVIVEIVMRYEYMLSKGHMQTSVAIAVMVGCIGMLASPGCTRDDGTDGHGKVEFNVALDANTLYYTTPVSLYIFEDTCVAGYITNLSGSTRYVAMGLGTGSILGDKTVTVRNRSRRIGPSVLAIVPYETQQPGGYVLKVPQLGVLGDMADISPGFPIPSDTPGVFGVERRRTDGSADVFVYDLNDGHVETLSSERIGLTTVECHLTGNRLIVSGLRSEGGNGRGEDVKRRHVTQVWKRPSMIKLSEYVGPSWMDAGNVVRPVVLGEWCAFKSGRGQWSIVGCDSGEILYTVGRQVSEDEWLDLRPEVMEVVSGAEYVKDTGLFVSVENTAKSDMTHIVSYRVSDGSRSSSITIMREKYAWCRIERVGGNWMAIIRTEDTLEMRPVEEIGKKYKSIAVPVLDSQTEAVGDGRFVSASDDMVVTVYELE